VLTYDKCQIVIDENYEECFSINIDDANVKVRRHILLILMDCTMSLSHQMSNYTLVDVACFDIKRGYIFNNLLGQVIFSKVVIHFEGSCYQRVQNLFKHLHTVVSRYIAHVLKNWHKSYSGGWAFIW